VIVGAHDTGPLIPSKTGFWLAIPAPAAGKALGGGRITPGAWERKTGLRLRFIYRRTGASLLVVDYVSMEQKIDNARQTRGGRVRANIGTRKGAVFSRLAGRATVFLLVSLSTSTETGPQIGAETGPLSVLGKRA